MNTFGSVMKALARLLSDKSPQILTGMAVAGVVSTTVLAVRVSPEAAYHIEHFEMNKHGKSTVLEKVKVAGPHYIPAAIVGSLTIACIISGNSISNKRNAALMGLYTITEQGFREYREKAVETFGKTKEKALRDDIAKDVIDRNPVSSREVIIVGGGDVLCYDSLSGRYFESDIETIRKSENDLNQKIINESYASQNDFYRLIGLPALKYGDEMGWSTDSMLNLDFTTVMSEDNRPCISLNYRMMPFRGFTSAFL